MTHHRDFASRVRAIPLWNRRVFLHLPLIAALLLLMGAGCGPGPTASGTSVGAEADERSGDAVATPGQLVLMTLNAHFLWDGEPPEDGDLDFDWKGSPQRADAHMAAIAAIVREHDPDVLQLLEVEDERALDVFNARHLSDAGYSVYFVDGQDTATGQDAGMLSRIPLQTFGYDTRRGRSGSTRKGVSKNYVATLDVGSLRLGFVGLHFLSGPTRENRKAPREAQADAVRGMARELESRGRSVIVWGDFNDFDGATLDRGGNRPISRVLEWIRAMDPERPDDDLWNVSERLPREQRYTHYGRDRAAIDHILVSPELEARVVDVEIGHRRGRDGPTPHAPIIVRLSTQ